MNKAIVRDSDGLVANVVSLPDDWTGRDGEWRPDEGHSLIDQGRGQPGDTWDGTEFVRPALKTRVDPDAELAEAITNATTLDELKDALLSRLTPDQKGRVAGRER